MSNLIVEWWEKEPKDIVLRFIEHCQAKQLALKKYSIKIENDVFENEYIALMYKDSVNETVSKVSRNIKDPFLKHRNKFFSIMFKNYNFNFQLKLAEIKSIKSSSVWLVEQYADAEEVLKELYNLFETRQNELVEENVTQVIDVCTLVEKLDIICVDTAKEYDNACQEREKVIDEMTGLVEQYIDRLDTTENDLQVLPLSINY